MLPGFRREQEERIGFSWLMGRCAPLTPFGRERKKAVAPFPVTELEALNRELDAVGRLLDWCQTNRFWIDDVRVVLERFKEIRGTLGRLGEEGRILDEVDLFELKNFAINAGDLRPLAAACALSDARMELPDVSGVVTALNPDPPVTRSFFLADAYAPELAAIRAEKQRIERELLNGQAGETPESRETRMKRRRELAVREREAEEQVRRTLTTRLRASLPALNACVAAVGTFDFLLAKVLLALELNAVRPELREDTKEYLLEDAVNPMVAAELAGRGRAFIPVSIALGAGANVITGANMGGKSVVLATVTLHAALAMCGFFVPAARLVMPPLAYLFYLSDDLQSVQQGLSTFGAEVAEVQRLLDLMRHGRGLAVLDEFARGTNPEEGEALMRALLEYVSRYNGFCLASTHYGNVVGKGMRHYQVIGLKRADFEELRSRLDIQKERSFDQLQEYMNYRLERVEWYNPPPRDAVRVAELLGLDGELLELARAKLRG
ncbi:MAG TPA: hypothetical protein VIV61_19080 [Candidatus Ozemobacteraceae bacterium]